MSNDTLRDAAAKIMTDVLSSKEERLAELHQMHLADCASYVFRCERHGGFLALFMTRGPYCELQSHKKVSCVNLNLAHAFHLNAGRAADMKGTINFSYDYDGKVQPVYSGGNYPRRQMISFPTQSVPFLQHHAVSTAAVIVPVGGFIPAHQNVANVAYAEPAKPLLDIYVKDGPRGPSDDTITCEGATFTLHIPFGLGQSIYEQILGALDDTPNLYGRKNLSAARGPR